jgi:TRAP-type C4-dicarboxylate transport system substrate-binding protein
MTTRLQTRTRRVLLAAAVPVLLAACSTATPVDKQGAPTTAVTELTLGAADPQDVPVAFFVDAVDRLSGHRVKVRVDTKTYESENPGGEAKLAGAVRSGTVQLGYVPSRDLAADGVVAFQALQSPFLIDTTPTAVTFAGRPLAGEVLASLDERGVHGLALIPFESRRLLSKRPVTSLGDLEGVQVRISDSDQTAKLVSAWGAVPVQGYVAAKTSKELKSGTLDAVESSPSYIGPNAYFSSAPYLTSFGMFPKFQVIVANARAWSALSDADRTIVSTAASQTFAQAVTATPREEAKALSQLCSRGVVVVQPSAQALDVLRAAAVKASPDGAAARGWLTKLRADLAAAQPSKPAAAPSGCPVATTAAQAMTLHAAAGAASTPSATPTTAFPTGTFVTLVTKEQWKAGAADSADFQTDITFTTKLNADGTYLETQQPDFPDQGPMRGTYKIDGDQVTFLGRQDSDPTTEYVETVKWSYFKGELHFVVVDVADSAGRVIYGQPWRKIG